MIKGPFLAIFPVPMQVQCSSEVTNQIISYPEEASGTDPTTARVSSCPVVMAASVLQSE